MRNVKDLKDVQLVLNEILDWKQNLETKINDMHGLQIRNLGNATQESDAVNYKDVKELLKMLKSEIDFKFKNIDLTLQKVKAALNELGYPVR